MAREISAPYPTGDPKLDAVFSRLRREVADLPADPTGYRVVEAEAGRTGFDFQRKDKVTGRWTTLLNVDREGASLRPPRRRISADRGDTSQTLVVGVDASIQRWATALTANRVVTLSTVGAVNGDRFRIVRSGLGAFTLDVGPGLKIIPASTAAAVEVGCATGGTGGPVWVLIDYGLL